MARTDLLSGADRNLVERVNTALRGIEGLEVERAYRLNEPYTHRPSLRMVLKNGWIVWVPRCPIPPGR